jgi:hypothetical protein
MGFARAVQVARLSGGPAGVPRAHRVGLAAIAKLGGEVSQWWLSRPCRGWCPVRPLSAGPGLNWARSGVKAAPAGTLC